MTSNSGPGKFIYGRLATVLLAVAVIVFLLMAVVSALSGDVPFLRGVTLRRDVGISQGYERGAGNLILNVNSCNSDPEVVDLQESDDEVKIRVESNYWPFRGGSDDCGDAVRVQLATALGDRAVIDGSNGKLLSVKHSVPVLGVEFRSPDRLILTADSCNSGAELVAREESQYEILVALGVSDRPVRQDSGCNQTVEMSLRDPWRGRHVVDMHTDETVPITRLRPVMEGQLLSPDVLSLAVGSCRRDATVSWQYETQTEVRVKIVDSAFPYGVELECVDAVRVQLEQPLGDRDVVDISTNQSVIVHGGVDILEAVLLYSDRLELHVDSCNGDPDLRQRTETDTDVQLLVKVPTSYYGAKDGCRDVFETHIHEPLGDRILIDSHSGQPVNVSLGPNYDLPAPEEEGMPDVTPSGIGDAPSEAELQDLQRIAEQKGISLEEAINLYGLSDNASLAIAKIRSGFPDAYAGSAIIQGGHVWIGFADDVPAEAVLMMEAISSLSDITFEVRTGFGFTEVQLQAAIPAAHYAVYESDDVREATSGYDYDSGELTSVVILERNASDSAMDDLHAAGEQAIAAAAGPTFLDSVTYVVERFGADSLGGDD